MVLEAETATAYASGLEAVAPAEELLFGPTPAFGRYRRFLEHAIEHPAKMNTRLLEFLVLRYTSEGDTVLDPMAGSGSTGVVAALHGRDAILVELEERFCRWIEEARRRVEAAATLGPKGRILSIRGDARGLPCVPRRVDAVITSPPYADENLSGRDPERRRGRLLASGHDPADFLGGRARNAVLNNYTDARNNWNIGCLPLGRAERLGPVAGGPEALRPRLMVGGRPTYLSEMLLVYGEVRRVLRPGGVAAVAVRPFIRHRSVIDLPLHTWRLLEAVGLRLEKIYKLRVKRQSFWRILYSHKNPQVPAIMHEYVIVARKTEGALGIPEEHYINFKHLNPTPKHHT